MNSSSLQSIQIDGSLYQNFVMQPDTDQVMEEPQNFELVKKLDGSRWLARRYTDGEGFIARQVNDFDEYYRSQHENPGFITTKQRDTKGLMDLVYEHNIGRQISHIFNHENIVSLAGYLRQQPLNAKPFSEVEATEDYLVWDNCDAGNLEVLLVDKDPQAKNRRVFMPESLCWHVLTSVMRALAWAHDGYRLDVDWETGNHGWAKTDTDWMPILHRAINPSTIMFQHPRGEELYGQCKLGHWGQAFVSGHPASRHERREGSEHKMVNAFGQIIAPHAGPSLLEGATREVSLAEMRKCMDKYTRDGKKDHRMYTLSDEHWALGGVLYRMMTAKELPSRDPCTQCAAGCFHVTACADTYCLIEEAESDQLDRWGEVDLDKTCRCDYGGCEHVREVIKVSKCIHPKWGPTCECEKKCGTKTVNVDDVLAQMDYSKSLLKAVRILFEWDWKFSDKGSVEMCGRIENLYAKWKKETGEGRDYVDVRDDARKRFLVLNGLNKPGAKAKEGEDDYESDSSDDCKRL